MASSKEYAEFVLGQLHELEDVTFRKMMGEYIVYYKGKIIGGIYDNRFLIKPVQAAVLRMPGCLREVPYKGAKEMLLVENIEDTAFLKELAEAMYPELPEPKPKKKKQPDTAGLKSKKTEEGK